MKLIIQIPCYNEEKTLGITLDQLPKEIEGFEKVEYLVIDDGSTDNTIQIAEEKGVHHIVKINRNKGLANAFKTGIENCIKNNADIIVNTDADNQYNAKDIKNLVKPILEKQADMVIGSRPITNIEHFSPLKKRLQKLGSWVVRKVSNTNVEDAPSGFRAISREAAMKLNVFDKYTYTIETLIQAGQKDLAVVSIPVSVNKDLRPSRLVKSIFSYINRSANTIVRMFAVYKPFKFFFTIGLTLFLIGFLIALRFLYFYFNAEGSGHIQSVILSGILLGMGFQTMLVALLADLISINRKLSEDIQYRIKKLEK